jgi:hypothetical protein
MKNIINLYVFIFSRGGLIKIGISSDVEKRLHQLKSVWGEIDCNDSYYLSAEETIVRNLEKGLHKMLDMYRVSIKDGYGKTEIFSNKALPHTIKYIELYCELNNLNKLENGIKISPEKTIDSLLVDRNRELKRNKILESGFKRYIKDLDRVNRKFERILFLILFLSKRRRRIQYEWDVVNGDLYFTMRLSKRHRVSGSSIIEMFSFEFSDFRRFSAGYSLCSCCYFDDDMVQYKIRLYGSASQSIYRAYLQDFFLMAKSLLVELPVRSDPLKVQ